MRDGICWPIEPREVFDISEVKKAFRFFGAQDRLGKVAIDFGIQSPAATIEVRNC